MAAILPPGMRAVSVEISPESAAGGFVLQNDRVDVILSRRDKAAEKINGGVETFTSEIILRDVRVLAIDQAVEEKDGQRVVVGKTATLELTPEQAEKLAVSRQMGSVSLALRSMADLGRKSEEKQEKRPPPAPTVVSHPINLWRGMNYERLTCPPNSVCEP